MRTRLLAPALLLVLTLFEVPVSVWVELAACGCRQEVCCCGPHRPAGTHSRSGGAGFDAVLKCGHPRRDVVFGVPDYLLPATGSLPAPAYVLLDPPAVDPATLPGFLPIESPPPRLAAFAS